MYRQMSRAQREAIFLEKTAQIYGALEDWYDQNPEASFGEIEAEARNLQRELIGMGLAVLINRRDTGYQLGAPPCSVCGQVMGFKGHRRWGISPPRPVLWPCTGKRYSAGLEGETTLMQAYYVCPECKGETPFPPGSKTAVASRLLE